MKVLVVGGAGYIGSNLCLKLTRLGYDVSIIDDFRNARKSNITRLSKAINKDITVIEGDACDKGFLDGAFRSVKPDIVVHFGNKKYIGESFDKSLDYYENNLVSTFNILRMCEKYNVNKLLFASSVSVYADSNAKIDEQFEREFVSPYNKSKIMAEEILTDWQKNNKDKVVIITRFTNPVGASAEGLGDRPKSGKTNVLPYLIAKVKSGEDIVINGGKFPTKDGSAVRDFIHVSDLTSLAAELIDKVNVAGTLVVNVGTGGDGYSVKDLIDCISKVLDKPISYTFNESADSGRCKVIVSVDKLKSKINVNINYGLEDIINSELALEQEGEDDEEKI